ncbi:MAG: hypothetical protein EKK42_27045 [Pseudonocardiaceae bacterium]|nr:MAG: hypothetical protein EKK42_27045 [Pseudonocardiaceae bacterium]
MPPTLTEAHPPLPLNELTTLIGSFSALPIRDKKLVIDRLVAVHPTFNVQWGGGWSYRRCRKIGDGVRPNSVNDLLWPKGVSAKLGRANPAGYQVLYLADRQDTAFQEARMGNGQAVVANFVIQAGRSIHVAPIGEIIQVHRTGRGLFVGAHSELITNMLNACNRDEVRSLLITDAFLLDCFVGHDDYDISSHVALSIFRKLPIISSVAYPSRRQLGGTNFAVRIERFWQDWALKSVRYGNVQELAMGFYKVSDAQAVSRIYADGRLDWEALDNPEARLDFEHPFVMENFNGPA